MKKGEKKKKQKALQRRAERKQIHRQARAAKPAAAVYHIRQARNYPIEGCWTQKDWKEHGLAVIVIARRQPNGNLVFGTYLVDYYCLGLKNTYCNADVAPGYFHRNHLPQTFATDRPINISPALAHEIIYGGIDYAAQFGFRPHPDFQLSQYVLDPPDLHPRTGAVEFGYKGKPFYIEGPDDNEKAIVRQLTRTAGEGNFDFLMQIAGSPPDWDEDLD